MGELATRDIDARTFGGRCPFRGCNPRHVPLDDRCPRWIPVFDCDVEERVSLLGPDGKVKGFETSAATKMPVPVLKNGSPCKVCIDKRLREKENGND
jgi:hypothetical protein